jgi:hypothetical protein
MFESDIDNVGSIKEPGSKVKKHFNMAREALLTTTRFPWGCVPGGHPQGSQRGAAAQIVCGMGRAF